jgi:hypothetical protein
MSGYVLVRLSECEWLQAGDTEEHRQPSGRSVAASERSCSTRVERDVSSRCPIVEPQREHIVEIEKNAGDHIV